MFQISLIDTVAGKVRTDLKCSACSLHDNCNLRTNKMSGVGPKPASIMFIGVAPGVEDDGIGQPMTGANGRLFRELLRDAQIRIDDVYVTNCLLCAVYDVTPAEKHWKECQHHFRKELEEVKPKVIVAVGADALRWMTGNSGIKKLLRHVLPSIIDPKYVVTPMQQPAMMFHVPPQEVSHLRESMVKDLIWIREQVENNSLIQEDLPTDYKVAKTREDVVSFLKEFEHCDEVTCDLETHGFLPMAGRHIAAVGLGDKQRLGHARVIPLYTVGINSLFYWSDEDLTFIKAQLKEFFTKTKVFGHNFIQFDQKWTKHEFGLEKCNIEFDTMLGHYLIDEERGTHDLEQIALLYTKMKPWKKAFTLNDTEKLCFYLCNDIDATSRIGNRIKSTLDSKQNWLLDNELIPLAYLLFEMEQRGVKVSRKGIAALQEEIIKKCEEERAYLKTLPEIQTWEFKNNKTFNDESPGHVAELMEFYFKFPCLARTDKGQYKTDKDVLKQLEDHPFPASILKLRRLNKLNGTYCAGLLEQLGTDDAAHPSYLLHGTVTGRSSSRAPNLYNVPRKDTAGQVLENGNAVKGTFEAREGYSFVQLDFSQIELRVLAILSADPEMTRIFKAGLDLHKATASAAYGIPLEQVTDAQRTAAKIINFGIVYGMTLDSLVKKFVQAGRELAKKAKRCYTKEDEASAGKEASAFYTLHRAKFPGVYAWLDEQERIIRHHRVQETVFGRRRHYTVIDSASIRQAYNFLIQSSSADCLWFSLLRISRALKQLNLDAFPILTVYDSVVLEVKDELIWEVAQLAQDIMQDLGFSWITIPLKADCEIGKNWGSLRKVDFSNKSFK